MKAMMTIIDVRTPDEFSMGNVTGSINIPLHKIHFRLEEIKQMQQPVVLCCASGSRSSQAATLLRSKGILCENGGCWYNLQK